MSTRSSLIPLSSCLPLAPLITPIRLFAVIGAAGALLACEQPPDDGAVTASAAVMALKSSGCVAERKACAAEAEGLSDADRVSCREQYAACLASADDDVPEPILAAASGSAQCARQELACRDGAPGEAERSACAADEAHCVAAALNQDLPLSVSAPSSCVAAALDCIDDARVTNDLVPCGGGLRDCAVADAQTSVSPEVSDALDDVNECRRQLDECVIAAETPDEIPACTEQQARCIADGLDVPVPDDTPPAHLIDCTSPALLCTLAARNLDSLDSCNRALARCVTDVIEEQLSCEQRWTRCVADKPWLLPICGLELLGCKD